MSNTDLLGDSLPPAPGEQVGEAVASIYVTPGGEREFDDWKCKLPPGRNLLYTAPPSTSALVEALEAIDRLDPHNDSTSEWNHAFGLVKAALAAHRKETA